MGDVSIIARRLGPNSVQYGWSGNGGYFSNVGCRLLEWYNDGDQSKIEDLFALGQLRLIGAPGSEKGGMHWYLTHKPSGEAHDIGTSEREIFSKIAFIDYGYFYDSDKKWYYIMPGPFRIKIPLETVFYYSDDNNNEFEFISKVRSAVMRYIFDVYYKQDKDFAALLDEKGLNAEALCEELCEDKCPTYAFYNQYPQLYGYFDDWIVFDVVQGQPILKIRKDTGKHEETITW